MKVYMSIIINKRNYILNIVRINKSIYRENIYVLVYILKASFYQLDVNIS